jgi:hypothetical protein
MKMKFMAKCLVLAAVVLGMPGCTTTGTGGGELADASGQERPVIFTWSSKDGGNSGTMMAALPGKLYQGRFFQITQQTSVDTLSPLWGYWHRGWYDWPYWGPMGPDIPSTQFITRYSGKVVATLDADGDHMRCRFHLAEPTRGMSGGGEGECQLSGGRVVHARFDAH